MNQSKRLVLSAMLVALMLILSYVESRIPVSTVPGIKLGLANCVLLTALFWLPGVDCWAIMIVRVLMSSLLFSGPIALIYSLAGGGLSLGLMQLLRKIPGISPLGLGIAGGAAHNIGQVLTAVCILKTPSLLVQLALLMPVGAGMGALTGILASILIKRIKLP